MGHAKRERAGVRLKLMLGVGLMRAPVTITQWVVR